MFFDHGQPKKQWIAYDNGSYEPVDPQGDLRKKPRDDRRMDWWVEDKTPDWRPDAYANTRRGKKAEQELGGIGSLFAKPTDEHGNPLDPGQILKVLPGDGSSMPSPGSKKSASAGAKSVQPQHANTGHASVRLGGPEDGKVTLLGGAGKDQIGAKESHPQPIGSLAKAEANQQRPDFASDTAGLNEAEKDQNRHDAGKNARDLHEAEGERTEKMKGLTFAGYLDDKPVYYGRTEGVLYDEEGIPATEDGLEKPLIDPVDMATLGGLAAKGYIKGVEIPLAIGKRKFRLALFGNRTDKPLGQVPHYHRNVPDPNSPGRSLKGQGIGRHRPWQKMEGDTSWKDRF